MKAVVKVNWEESEEGWGTRPDGCSIHTSKEAYKTYLEKYWADQPDEVPEEYSRPCSEPKSFEISDNLYTDLLTEESKGNLGMRFWQHKLKELKE